MTVDNLRSYLLNLPAFMCDHDDDEQKCPLLSEIAEELEKATTINKIFDLLSTKYASFLNYDIFQGIGEKYSIKEQDHEELNYSEHLKTYINRHKLSEFVELNPALENFTDVSKKLILKLDINLSFCKLADVFELNDAIAEILNLKPSALRLLSVKEGCVVVTFLIPASVAEIIFSSGVYITAKQEEFRALSVRWLKCGDYMFDFRGKSFRDADSEDMKDDAGVSSAGNNTIHWDIIV